MKGRLKHKQWIVTIEYGTEDSFSRVYRDKTKAERFAERQRKSPAVKAATVKERESTKHSWRLRKKE